MNASIGIRALEKAISQLGGQAALAREIDVTQQTISYWILNSKRVPAEKAILIEEATGGTVTRQQLRPDLYSTKH